MKYSHSLNKELHSLMESDNNVVIIGEDILDPYGGAFKITTGLSSRFPEKTFTSPISEAAIIGIATGLAIRGFRPIVEIMFGDFLLLGADQLVNHAAKFKWIYNDTVKLSMVIRTPMGGRRGYGPTHSQCLEKHFIGTPGLWIVAANIVSNPGDLLRRSLLECSDPVLFIENKTCYGRTLIDKIPNMSIEKITDNTSPFCSILISHDDRKSSSDGLLFCYGGMLPLCLEAVKHLKSEEGIYINIAMLEQVSPIPHAHLCHILDKYNDVNSFFYTEESNTIGGWSSEMIASIEEIQHTLTSRKDIKHIRIGSKFTHIPASKDLEMQTLPQTNDIISIILECF